MISSVKIYDSAVETSLKLADDIIRRIIASATSEKPFSIALSGGSTPELLYSMLFGEMADSVPWDFVHLYWGDERCVPAGSADSNYGLVHKYLRDDTGLPAANIHRMKGEEEPAAEAIRYSGELSSTLLLRNGVPVIDLILLGMGDDGHTASIFPDQIGFFNSDNFCEVATHPVTGQKRITLTGKVINNAEAVVFLITGKKKAEIIRQILRGDPESITYPASHVKPVYGSLDFYLDNEAGGML